ncbi:hypothetical protein [Paludisphaera sp.]|uniref:hypothetical protein n=1 Tax=Paludisphaera sp. TaxID=2017432 RepID=UPI00301BE017
MRSDPGMPARLAALAWALALAAGGCGEGGGFVERSGAEALRRLPPEVADLVPEDAVLCLDEARADGDYRIWILRRPGGTWLDLPAERPRAKGAPQVESHDMPPSALLGVLRSRTPGLDPGEPAEPRCRFSHWKLPDGAEVQVRELVTDRGWFASVERVAL